MGYYNPIYHMGVETFLTRACEAGVDGLIVVDLPPEEDDELCVPALKAGLNFIRLATPTTGRQETACRSREHLGLRLLCLDHRHHRLGEPGSAQCRGIRGADQTAYLTSRCRWLRNQDAGTGSRYCACRRWGSRRLRHRRCHRARDRCQWRHQVRRRGARSGFCPGRLPMAFTTPGRRRPSKGVHAMNWINNVVRPKIQRVFNKKQQTPDNLWHKCSSCGEMIFHRDLEAAMRVCPNCDHHMRLGTKERFAALFDKSDYQLIATDAVALDPLKFRDQKKYPDRLKEARTKTGRDDAVTVAHGPLDGVETVIAIEDFSFMGGSLGMAAGEAHHQGRGSRAREEGTLYPLYGGRRCAHAGRHSFAHADAAHDGCAATAARGGTSLHRGSYRPDDRRRARLLRHAGRHPCRRTQGADRLFGTPRH